MATTLLNRYQSDPIVQIVTGVCPHDCPDSCSWQVAVDRATGRALDIWGHPEHPVTAWMHSAPRWTAISSAPITATA